MSKLMKHTNYSDYIILNEVQKYHDGKKYDTRGRAFAGAAKILGCRYGQVSGRYYKLKEDNITVKDVSDFTEEDKFNYSPGDPEKIIRHYDKGQNRTSGHTYDIREGVSEERDNDPDATPGIKIIDDIGDSMGGPINLSEKTKENIGDKITDNSQTVYLSKIRNVINNLVKDTPGTFKLDIIEDLVSQLSK